MRFLCVVFFLVIFPIRLVGYLWPWGNGLDPLRVTSTFGEYRVPDPLSEVLPYTIKHFHDGIDIGASEGQNVYAVEPEYVWDIRTKSVLTDYHDFRHINPRNGLEIGQYINIDTILGYIRVHHLHFSDEDYQTDYGFEWNMIWPNQDDLHRFDSLWEDIHPPRISSHWFFEDQTRNRLYSFNLYGKVDILIFAEDSTTYPEGVDPKNGVFQVGYSIDYEPWQLKHQFDLGIYNWDIGLVYDTVWSNNSYYLYWVTNDMGSNDYWDTAEYSDGFHIVNIWVADAWGKYALHVDTVYTYNTGIEEPPDTDKVIFFFLSQNFPNPFFGETTINYSIASKGDVSLWIYEISGRLVRKFVEENKNPGHYRVIWDGRNQIGEKVPAGTYFVRLLSGDFSKTKKMLLIHN